MSGVTEVRLYRDTVDSVLVDCADVTAAVLNNSLAPDHGGDIKRYLDGFATVSGLAGGTAYYFWVEHIDAHGNTASARSRPGATGRRRSGSSTLRTNTRSPYTIIHIAEHREFERC
jgi:hypothetical protein